VWEKVQEELGAASGRPWQRAGPTPRRNSGDVLFTLVEVAAGAR